MDLYRFDIRLFTVSFNDRFYEKNRGICPARGMEPAEDQAKKEKVKMTVSC